MRVCLHHTTSVRGGTALTKPKLLSLSTLASIAASAQRSLVHRPSRSKRLHRRALLSTSVFYYSNCQLRPAVSPRKRRMVHGARLLRHFDFPASEVLGPAPAEVKSARSTLPGISGSRIVSPGWIYLRRRYSVVGPVGVNRTQPPSMSAERAHPPPARLAGAKCKLQAAFFIAAPSDRTLLTKL